MNAAQLRERLTKFTTYEKGWDGYKAEPIAQAVIDEGYEWVNEYPELFDFVAPLGDGGIQFERQVEKDGPFFEFEIWEDGEHVFLSGTHDGDILHFWEELDGLDRDGVRAALARWKEKVE